jgi:hypothetical protein
MRWADATERLTLESTLGVAADARPTTKSPFDPQQILPVSNCDASASSPLARPLREVLL